MSLPPWVCRCADQHCVGKSTPLTAKMQDIVNDLERAGIDTITSGVRCAAHNEAVGGAKTSRHLFGDALDIVPHESRCELIEYLLTKKPVRIITYLTLPHVHVQADEWTSIWVQQGKGYVRVA